MPFPILCSGAWVWTAPPIVLHFSGSTLLIQYTRVSFWLIFFSFYYFVCYSNCAFTYWWQSLVFICLFGWLIPYVFYWLVQLLFLVYFLFSYFEIFFIVIALMFELFGHIDQPLVLLFCLIWCWAIHSSYFIAFIY